MPDEKSFGENTIRVGTHDARMRWGRHRLGIPEPIENIAGNEFVAQISVRPARMGFLRGSEEQRNESLSTPEELDEASQIVKKINNVARFGYQIPAYSVARTVEASKRGVGEFAALVFPGTQNDTGSIWGNMDWIEKQWGKDIKQKFPNIDFSSWFSGLFKFTGVGRFSQMYHDNEQRITILRDKLKNPQGQVSVLGMPAIDTQFYGYPPYTATSGRPSKSLTFINFDSPDSKELYENGLLKHKSPLRLQNAVHSVLFSPDVTKNLVGLNSSHGFGFVIKDGIQQEPFYKNMDSALNDLSGLGFDYLKSSQTGNVQPRVE